MTKLRLQEGPFLINHPTLERVAELVGKGYKVFYVAVTRWGENECVDIGESTLKDIVKDVIDAGKRGITAGTVVCFKVKETIEIEEEENYDKG